MTHDNNLARVQALRDDPLTAALDVDVLDHIEDVLNWHAPDLGDCRICEPLAWPCPDYASALALLDALDRGTDE